MARGTNIPLRAGDWVQIKSQIEIAETLDADGMLEGLPFMPEMLEFCGKPARVMRRAEKTCIEYPGGEYKSREFVNNNVVLLDTPRCSGMDHDGCQRACLFFWKESWLRELEPQQIAAPAGCSAMEELRAKLKTKASSSRYICQSTELNRATKALPRPRILLKCIYDVRSGSREILEMTRMVLGPMWKKATVRIPRRKLAGSLKKTPVGNLALQPGEMVTIKPAVEIAKTLDDQGRNRGLLCDYGMANYSGGKFRVRHRLERMISEATGEMRNVNATVVLDGLNCTCNNVVGGCPRQDFMYWREIWLERINAPESNANSGKSEEQALRRDQRIETST
jgi:hypothetical protein